MRVQKLGSLISESAAKMRASPVRPGVVHKAALLAKTDLTTELVKEFTELQGIVGGLYAQGAATRSHTCPTATADAIGDVIYDQYKPESMDDSVPRSVEGAVLAIADKADSIAGMFALGTAADGLEGSLCAAPRGQRHREDYRRAQAAAAVCASCSRTRAAEYAGSEAGTPFSPKTLTSTKRWRTSCASVWNSTCATCAALPTTW